ncbi:VOC family protein [Rhizobium bangladeshense]|uniref:VOC family protein n=1 Tax=Rhizobium bangladeshense TaxID=1138189 RepID=UPI002180A4F8|nr:hypothetical protein [Rhizobium bangladeshense]
MTVWSALSWFLRQPELKLSSETQNKLDPHRKPSTPWLVPIFCENRQGPRRGADVEFARLKDRVTVVHAPKDLPWGNRTAQFSDPEGIRVALYTPVTEAESRRFADR